MSNNSSTSATLYIQIRDDVVDQIIKRGLSRAESKLFFYFSKLSRFGDRPVKVKVAEVLLGAGICRSAYHAAIVKFEKMGWFKFTDSDIEVYNYCTPTKLSTNVESQSANVDNKSTNVESQSANVDTKSTNVESKRLKVLPVKGSKTSHTLQTYSDLLNTLSEDQREGFKKFCLKKIEECSFKIGSKEAWLNKYGAEYLKEFQEMYSESIASDRTARKTESSRKPTVEEEIRWLKMMYGDEWEEVAIHRGYITRNSPEAENKV